MQLESLEMREIGEQEESQVPVPEEKDTPMEEINDRPETTEDNVKDNMFHDLVFVQLSSKYQMVVRQREKFKQRTTELEEELRLCQSTLLKLRQNQKTIIRSAIRKAVAVAVEKTKKELEKVSVHCLLVHRTHTNVYLPFLRQPRNPRFKRGENVLPLLKMPRLSPKNTELNPHVFHPLRLQESLLLSMAQILHYFAASVFYFPFAPWRCAHSYPLYK